MSSNDTPFKTSGLKTPLFGAEKTEPSEKTQDAPGSICGGPFTVDATAVLEASLRHHQ